MGQGRALEQVAGWLGAARHVVALTGAGISTASGIPDYRGPQGLWTKDPAAERLSNIRDYVADEEVRRASWRRRVAVDVLDREPNAAHHALAALAAADALHLLVTQNVDGLHHVAGHDPADVVEVHGTVRTTGCLSCGEQQPSGPVHARVRAGDDDPRCATCGGILKVATVSFGQPLVPEDLTRALQGAADADVLLCLGTSLGVYPVAGMAELAAASPTTRLVVVNQQPTPFDPHADVVLSEDLTEVLPQLAGLVAARG